MEVYHVRPIFGGDILLHRPFFKIYIYLLYIKLYGRYLQFRFLKWPLNQAQHMKLRGYTDRGRCKPAVQQPNHTVQALPNRAVLSKLFLVHDCDPQHLLTSSWQAIGSYLDHLVWLKIWFLSLGTFWHLIQLCGLSACRLERGCSKHKAIIKIYKFGNGLSSHVYLK